MIQHMAEGVEHIYIALGHTDFRKQISGLTSMVALHFKLDPYSGASLYLFCNKKHSATKSLADEMKFQWPKNQGEVRDITQRQLKWLLEGLKIDQKKAHPDNIDTCGMIF